jgi:hypothetical protein
MKHDFKVGEKVVCKIQHHSTAHVSWNPAMDKIIGVTGIVVSTGKTFDNKTIVRVDFGGLHETLIWTMDPKWLERAGQQHKFKAGDKVICKESHTGSQFPKWHDCMDAFVGAHGTVLSYITTRDNEYVRVTFSPRLSETHWCFLEEWLVPATQDNTQDKMTTTPAIVRRTFTTTVAVDITLTNGEVTSCTLREPKQEAQPEPEKPKFQKGDIVMCKTRPQGVLTGHLWEAGKDILLGVPGRVVGPACGRGVSVEFLGYRVVYDFLEDWLVHEEPDIAKTMQDLFARKK